MAITPQTIRNRKSMMHLSVATWNKQIKFSFKKINGKQVVYPRAGGRKNQPACQSPLQAGKPS